ncbi:MAG: DUF202 domain-containing protein [Thermaerobacter sp.]|nr:DUF202 domain-containing protein [Thermaerobacter sp.]
MADVQEKLAAERTFLAWIRTSVSIMAFGFVVARFDWFLYRSTSTAGTILGALLTASGGLFAILAAARFWRESRYPHEGHPRPTLAIAAGGAVALSAVLLTAYLLAHRLSV